MPEKKFVLVVEDDPFYSKIYETKLAKENIHAALAMNGDAALKVIEKMGAPDLILLDLIMPGKDGFDTLKDLKADSTLKHIPVIVLSNLSQEEDIKRVMDLGAAEYLVKANVPLQEIIAKVKSYLAV